jgi:hypothetical protein
LAGLRAISSRSTAPSKIAASSVTVMLVDLGDSGLSSASLLGDVALD